jgi:hypothetical protein
MHVSQWNTTPGLAAPAAFEAVFRRLRRQVLPPSMPGRRGRGSSRNSNTIEA